MLIELLDMNNHFSYLSRIQGRALDTKWHDFPGWTHRNIEDHLPDTVVMGADDDEVDKHLQER